MAKIILSDLSNLQNETSAVLTLNNNTAFTEVAFENTLSRDGTTPNQMAASLDMNSNRILNLPSPSAGTEPLRLTDLDSFLHGTATFNTATNATNILHTHSSAGGVQRSLDKYLEDVVNVKSFGATGDGATNDATTIGSAATSARASGKPLYFPAGTYQISTAIDVSGISKVFGDGCYLSIIRSTSATADALSKNSVTPIIIRDLKIASTPVKSAGAGIRIAGNSEGDRIQNVLFTDQFRAIQVDAAISYHIFHCEIVDTIDKGIYLQNTANADSGDGRIAYNLFSTSKGGSTVACYQISSGGLSFIGNKILKHTFGFYLDVGAADVTGILDISNNSFDSQADSCIYMQSIAGGSWLQTNITDNILIGANAPTNTTGTCIKISGSNSSIARVSITGGTMGYVTNGINISGGSAIDIQGVSFTANAVGNPTAIVTSASWPNSGNIGQNFYYFTTSTVNLNGNTAVALGPPTIQLGPTIPTGNNIIEISSSSATPRFIEIKNSAGTSQYGVDAAGAAYAWLASGTGGTFFGAATNCSVDVYSNNLRRIRVDGAGNIVPGTAALATNATDGFVYIQSCAGVPTGVPAAYTGRVATFYDTTNNKFYVYNGAWKSATLA